MIRNNGKIFFYLWCMVNVLCGSALASRAQSQRLLTEREHRYFSLSQIGLAKNFLDASPEHLELCNKHGWTPLTIAAVAGHADLVDDLIRRNAHAHSTALAHVVANPDSLPMVKRLVQAGAFRFLADRTKVLLVVEERVKNGAHPNYSEIKKFLDEYSNHNPKKRKRSS